MKKYGIPTAGWESFSDAGNAKAYLEGRQYPVVIKCDGLALGKGVIIADTPDKAKQAIDDMLVGGKFAGAGRNIVIEEYMEGREVTVLAFCDGKTVIPMPASRDHKRALDGDRGLNTGGMGAICPVPDYTPELAGRCMNDIFLPTVRAMENEGCPFSGVIYFGLMLTRGGPKVVEYNARFGDPEAQVVLSLLETDLMEIFLAVDEKRLSKQHIKWSEGSAAVVVMASRGYPGDYDKGIPISGLDKVAGCTVYHAGTEMSGSGYLTSGGRVLGVTAFGGTLDEALDTIYSNIEKISFAGAQFRRDIGKREKKLT